MQITRFPIVEVCTTSVFPLGWKVQRLDKNGLPKVAETQYKTKVQMLCKPSTVYRLPSTGFFTAPSAASAYSLAETLFRPS